MGNVLKYISNIQPHIVLSYLGNNLLLETSSTTTKPPALYRTTCLVTETDQATTAPSRATTSSTAAPEMYVTDFTSAIFCAILTTTPEHSTARQEQRRTHARDREG